MAEDVRPSIVPPARRLLITLLLLVLLGVGVGLLVGHALVIEIENLLGLLAAGGVS